MSIVKTFRFPVAVSWQHGRLTRATVSGKPPLEVATPPEFKGGLRGYWSPEDLLVAAVGSCFVVTLAAVAERRDLPLLQVNVEGEGHVGRHGDGTFGFDVIELRASVVTTSEAFEAVERAAHKAEELCLVSSALDVPVHLHVEVSTTDVVPMSSVR